MLYRAKLHDDLVYKALGNLIQEPIDRDSFDYYKKVLGKYVFQIKQKNKTNIKDAVGFIAGLNYDFGEDIFKRFQSLDEYLRIRTSLEDNLLLYLFDEDFKNINQYFATDNFKIISENEIYIPTDEQFSYGDIIKIYKNNEILCIGKIISKYAKIICFDDTYSDNPLFNSQEFVYNFKPIQSHGNIFYANNIKILKMNDNKNIVMIYRENNFINIEDYKFLKRIEPVYVYLIVRNLFPVKEVIQDTEIFVQLIKEQRADLTDYTSRPELSPISADAMVDSDTLSYSIK
jgi:hypothetical protein